MQGPHAAEPAPEQILQLDSKLMFSHERVRIRQQELEAERAEEEAKTARKLARAQTAAKNKQDKIDRQAAAKARRDARAAVIAAQQAKRSSRPNKSARKPTQTATKPAAQKITRRKLFANLLSAASEVTPEQSSGQDVQPCAISACMPPRMCVPGTMSTVRMEL